MLALPTSCNILIVLLFMTLVTGCMQQGSEHVNLAGSLIFLALTILSIAVSIGPANSTEIAASLASEYAVVMRKSEIRSDTPIASVALP